MIYAPIARPASLRRLSSCFINGIFSCLQGDARGHLAYVSDTSSFDNVAVFDIQEIGTGQPGGVGLWAFICRWKLVSKYEKWSCWSAVFGHLRGVLQNEIHGDLLSLKLLLSFQCHKDGSLFTHLAQNSNSCWTRNLIRSRLCSEFCCKWHILTDTLNSAEAMRLWIHMQPVDPSCTDINNAGMLPWWKMHHHAFSSVLFFMLNLNFLPSLFYTVGGIAANSRIDFVNSVLFITKKIKSLSFWLRAISTSLWLGHIIVLAIEYGTVSDLNICYSLFFVDV